MSTIDQRRADCNPTGNPARGALKIFAGDGGFPIEGRLAGFVVAIPRTVPLKGAATPART